MVWLFNKNIRQARAAKEVHDTYKVMYENVQETLLQLQDDNRQLNSSILRLEAAIRRATHCTHYAVCPIRAELHHHSKDRSQRATNPAPRKQHPQHRQHETDDVADSASVHPLRYREDEPLALEPP